MTTNDDLTLSWWLLFCGLFRFPELLQLLTEKKEVKKGSGKNVTPPGSATTRDQKLEPQYMDEFGIFFEQTFRANMAVLIGVTHRAWKNKIEDYDPDGDGIYHFANEKNFVSGDNDWGKTYKKYDAFIVSLKKLRGYGRFQFIASYTWSRLKGFSADDDEDGWGNDPYRSVNAFGFLPNDVRHQLRFYSSVLLPLDISCGVNFLWLSGQPYTETATVLYNDGGATLHNGKHYPYLTAPRGTSGRYPANWRLDVHIKKRFKYKKGVALTLYADIFNLFNYQGKIARNNQLGQGYLVGETGSNEIVFTIPNQRYGRYTAWNAPMSLVLGAKL